MGIIIMSVTIGLLLLVCTVWNAKAAMSASANMPKELTFMQKVMSPITSPMMSPKGGAGADPPVRVRGGCGHVTVPADKLGWYTGPATLSECACAHLCKVHLSRVAFLGKTSGGRRYVSSLRKCLGRVRVCVI